MIDHSLGSRSSATVTALTGLANPARFMAATTRVAPILATASAMTLTAGVAMAWRVPPDYQQGETVRILFVHVPAALIGMLGWLVLAGASFFGLIYRHALADAAARAVAPVGATFTALGLVTGSIWGRPEWGTWWVWDARLTSFLILFLMYLAYMALVSAFDDEARGARMGAILGLIGLVMLPVVHYSVTWWNSLHQGETLLRRGGSGLAPVYFAPFALLAVGYLLLFFAVWITRLRAEVWRRRALAPNLRSAA